MKGGLTLIDGLNNGRNGKINFSQVYISPWTRIWDCIPDVMVDMIVLEKLTEAL
jgi:hypothetical protein